MSFLTDRWKATPDRERELERAARALDDGLARGFAAATDAEIMGQISDVYSRQLCEGCGRKLMRQWVTQMDPRGYDFTPRDPVPLVRAVPCECGYVPNTDQTIADVVRCKDCGLSIGYRGHTFCPARSKR